MRGVCEAPPSLPSRKRPAPPPTYGGVGLSMPSRPLKEWMSSRRLNEGLRPGLGNQSCRLKEGSRDELLDVLAQLNCLPASGACVRSCSLGLGLGLGVGVGLGAPYRRRMPPLVTPSTRVRVEG